MTLPLLGPEAMPPLLTSQRLTTLSYAVVDVETTGGSPWTGHRVTEIAAVIVRNGRVTETYETLVNPERSIPPFITRLTHITPSMVCDQPPFNVIAPRVAELLRGHVFVAHNAAFDRRFVENGGSARGVLLDGRARALHGAPGAPTRAAPAPPVARPSGASLRRADHQPPPRNGGCHGDSAVFPAAASTTPAPAVWTRGVTSPAW